PSRGALLNLLLQMPTLTERINQGGLVGYIIILLGLGGIGIAVERIVRLDGIARTVKTQLASGQAGGDTPLGRVWSVYQNSDAKDVEALELKLDDAILKEIPPLERNLSLLKLLAGVAPLLGLLGTVTGMILTFQAITLFGTGDPKLMAGGISQALITTVLGLVVAIPLLLLHAAAATRSREIVQILEEQATGMIAAFSEKK
ncbi:MAG: MotA/TolQ/ExbB proton channel family protein, partial [Pseudomonadota bacterium]|nr:MotA/TolQ/ExbB proton channel family protein [Pseudomonadota bacterium]